MKKLIFSLIIFISFTKNYSQNKISLKKHLISNIENQKNDLIKISNKIWAAAEIAFQEEISSKTLIDYAKINGFEVAVGVAETPTAFVASYGSGRPIIGILGEFDALPGLSQTTSPLILSVQ